MDIHAAIDAIDPSRVQHARAVWSGVHWVVRVDVLGGITVDLDGFADRVEAERRAAELCP